MLCASCWFLSHFLLWSWRMRHVPQKRLLTFNGLPSIISHKTEPYISVLWGNIVCCVAVDEWWRRSKSFSSNDSMKSSVDFTLSAQTHCLKVMFSTAPSVNIASNVFSKSLGPKHALQTWKNYLSDVDCKSEQTDRLLTHRKVIPTASC
jgi:hypothetical protein